MELNLVPLIEAAKGLTWQGAIVSICGMALILALALLRHIHGNQERRFWLAATPEQIMARAATAATMPPPTKAPHSPVGPAIALLVLAAGLMLRPSLMSSGPWPGKVSAAYSAPGDYTPDPRPRVPVALSLATVP